MIPYSDRDILTDRDEQARWRVLNVVRHPQHDCVWLYDMLDPAAWPVRACASETDKRVDAEELQKLDLARAETRTVTAKMRRRSAEVYALLKHALEDQPRIFTKEGRIFWLATLRQSVPTLRAKRFNRYLRRWFRSGMVPDGLLPDWDNCRAPTAVDLSQVDQIPFDEAKKRVQSRALAIDLTDPDTPRRGRLPKQRPASYYVINTDTVVVFDHYYKQYRAPGAGDLELYWNIMVGEVFSSLDQFGKLRVWDVRCIPSKGSFVAWYYKMYTHEQRRRAHIGDLNFDTQERASLGDSTVAVPFAGAVAQLDATIFSVNIVARFTHRPPIGCPVVFRLRETKTGQLLGLAVSLDNASWTGAAAAIANCLEDKAAFCRKYGIELPPGRWEACGLPSDIDADRGETEGYGPEEFTRKTGVEVRNIAGRRPDIKGGIESDWNTLTVSMTGETPGQIIERHTERGGHWKITATLDIDQFMTKLLLYEIERSGKTRKGTPLDEDAIARGFDNSPGSMWSWATLYGGGKLRQFDLATVQYALMRTDKASITEHGLHFRGCYYKAPELERRGWFSQARIGRRWTVDVKFDPRLADNIYLIDDPERDRYVHCKLTRIARQLPYFGKTFAEVKILQEQETGNNVGDVQAKQQEAVENRFKHQAINDAANEMTKTARQGAPSKTALLNQVRPNRQREQWAHSPTQAFQPHLLENSTRTSEPATPSEASPGAATPNGQSQPATNVTPFPNRDERAATNFARRLNRFSPPKPHPSKE